MFKKEKNINVICEGIVSRVARKQGSDQRNCEQNVAKLVVDNILREEIVATGRQLLSK